MPPRVAQPGRGRGRGRGRHHRQGGRRRQAPLPVEVDVATHNAGWSAVDDWAVEASQGPLAQHALNLQQNTITKTPMTPQQVGEWLVREGLGEHVEAFTSRNIDGEMLVTLDDTILQRDLGISNKDSRDAIMVKLESLCERGVAEEDYQCVICHDIMIEPVTLPCGHSFDRSCLARWKEQNPTCPNDRSAIPDRLPMVSILLKNIIDRKFPEHVAQGKDASTRNSAAAARAAERAKREADKQAASQKITQLQSHFRVGNTKLDADTLQAILDMFNGDVKESISFLELQGEPPADYVELADLNRENPSVPKDYNQNPAGMQKLQARVGGSLLDSLKAILLSDKSTYAQHLEAQTVTRNAYFALLRIFLVRGVELSHGSKARCLAACWARKDREMSAFILGAEAQGILNANASVPDVFGLADILKAVKILDAPRLIRVAQRKIDKLTQQGAHERSLAQLRASINELQRETLPRGSLSGALVKFLRKTVVSQIPQAKLEYFAMQLPSGPWRELADLLHINPSNGLTVNWFLPRSFGVAPPEDCIVSKVANINAGNLMEILTQWKPPFSFIRAKVPQLPAPAKKFLVQYIPMNQCLWWHHELVTPEVDQVIAQRLADGDVPTLPYGKLMERLMYFSQLGNVSFFEKLLPVAEGQLSSMRLTLESPVAILGDASYSMDVAIRCSVIISSVIAALSPGSELRFFNDVSTAPDSVPSTAQECLHVASITRASGQTAPAVALWEYYESKKVVKTFIVVTDERENKRHNGYYFHQLFYKYFTEVFPARIVFVSFLQPNEQGQMTKALENLGIIPIRFAFDARRPDLTKFDALLGLLSASTDAFSHDLEALEVFGTQQADAKAEAQ